MGVPSSELRDGRIGCAIHKCAVARLDQAGDVISDEQNAVRGNRLARARVSQTTSSVEDASLGTSPAYSTTYSESPRVRRA